MIKKAEPPFYILYGHWSNILGKVRPAAQLTSPHSVRRPGKHPSFPLYRADWPPESWNPLSPVRGRTGIESGSLRLLTHSLVLCYPLGTAASRREADSERAGRGKVPPEAKGTGPGTVIHPDLHVHRREGRMCPLEAWEAVWRTGGTKDTLPPGPLTLVEQCSKC